MLGNLCYDSPQGRERIAATSCLDRLAEVVASEAASSARDDPGQRLPVILPGFLLNFCNGTPAAAQLTCEFIASLLFC